MELEKLVAIDVHTHAWKSALAVDDRLTESQEAMGRYFRYQPQHQTVPEMAEMYRKLKMAFDGEHHEGHLQLAVHLRHLGHGLVLRLVAEVAPHRFLRLGGSIVDLQRRLPGVRVDVDGDEVFKIHGNKTLAEPL